MHDDCIVKDATDKAWARLMDSRVCQQARPYTTSTIANDSEKEQDVNEVQTLFVQACDPIVIFALALANDSKAYGENRRIKCTRCRAAEEPGSTFRPLYLHCRRQAGVGGGSCGNCMAADDYRGCSFCKSSLDPYVCDWHS